MRRLTRRFAVAFCVSLLLATVAVAQPGAPRKGPSFSLVVEGVLELGGDRVAEVLFEDGGTQSVRAGQGGTAAIGGEFRPTSTSPFGVRATIGYKYVTTAATNADIMLTRIPIELVGSVTFARDFRVGAGYVYHTGIQLDAGGVGEDIGFEGAHGATIEVGWRWLALTYTKLTYTDDFGNKYDASSGGLSFTGKIRLR